MSDFLDVDVTEVIVSAIDETLPTVIEVADPTDVVELTVIPDVLLPDVIEVNTGTRGPEGLPGATGPTGPTGPAGQMNGPASSTDKALARFNGLGGKTLQNSAVIVDDTPKLGIGAAPVERLDVFGGLADTAIRMAYNGGATSYSNAVKSVFSGTQKDHSLAFLLRQNSTDHTLLTMYADERSIFKGTVGVNLGTATPLAPVHAGTTGLAGEAVLMGYGADLQYRCGFRTSWSGATLNSNTVTFHHRQGVDSTDRDIWTVRGDGVMTHTTKVKGPTPTETDDLTTKAYVDARTPPIVMLTQAQYDALGVKDPNTLYGIT